MKIFWITLLIIVGLVITVAIIGFSGSKGNIAGYSRDDQNAPRLEIEEKKFDFGKIAMTDVVKHDFKVKNVGKNPLVMTDLMTSCHCTTAILKVSGKPDSPEFGMHTDSLWRGEIPAGGEAVVEAVYTPAKMPVSGQVSRVISFSTNDPFNKEAQLEMIGIVQ